MSGAEADETQSVLEDGGQGPGAPTPLSVLEVKIGFLPNIKGSFILT